MWMMTTTRQTTYHYGSIRAGISALLLAASVSACIAFPVPPPESPAFEEESLPLIAGHSTRDDVRIAFSEAPFRQYLYKFGDDTVWVYHSISAGWGFFLGGISQGGSGWGTSTNVRNLFLVVKFDEEDTVTAYYVVKLHWGCKESGLCRAPYHGGASGQIMVLADAEADQKAKAVAAPQSGCALYVYADLTYAYNLPMSITVDGVMLGWLTHERGHYLHKLDSGSHIVAAEDEESLSESAEIDCVDGDVHFVHIVHKTSFWGKDTLEIGLESIEQGQEDIRDRQLVLTADPTNPAGEEIDSDLSSQR